MLHVTLNINIKKKNDLNWQNPASKIHNRDIKWMLIVTGSHHL